MNDEVLNLEQAAILIGVHPVTLRKMAASGEIPARKVGREWRFNRAAIMQWLTGDYDNERAKQCQSEKTPKQGYGNSTYLLMGDQDTSVLASQRLKKKPKKCTTKSKPIFGDKLILVKNPSTHGLN
ncbi:MAG: hypothetical protein CTY37_07120 [Methylotenera sp.]|nr:MAG: hypothetical protein CTY37_07120 [Methylotenera sp.]PPD17732.1 MAG: hypothetical protein CTY27_03240 [Methylotenera sp.]